jgi:hypothetical protein
MNIAVKVPVATPEITIRKLAIVAVQGNPDDAQAAAGAVYSALQADPAAYNALAHDLIMVACRNAVASLYASSRAKARHAASKHDANQKAGVVALAAAQREVMMEYVCAGGVRLRNATRDVLARTIRWKEEAAGTLKADAIWLEHVMQGVSDGKTVADAFTEQRLIELRASLNGNGQ